MKRRLARRRAGAECTGDNSMVISMGTCVIASLLGAASGGTEGTQGVPVLVELFTSEGCSSCPPADDLLARLLREQPISEARVIALSEHVDYWDDLGWKDSLSSPLFTRRQREYVRRLGLTGPYTPQLVVGGRLQALGGDEPAARSAIAEVARSSRGSLALRILEDGGGTPALDVRATWGGGQAEVVAAIVTDRVASRVSRVSRGENAGRTLVHVSAVRSMVTVGSGAGAFSGRLPLEGTGGAHEPGHAVVFVQAPGGGRVYAAETIALPDRSRASAGRGR